MNKIFSSALIFGIAILLASCGVFSKNAKKAFSQNKALVPYDVIIVPGVPFYGDTLERVMQLRVLWADYLYRNGYTKNIIYSGGAVYTPYSEAKVMALTGEAMGIPKANIFVEEAAEHSVENVYYAYQIAKKQGFEKIALATDPFQTKNLYLFLNKFDLPIQTLPAIFDTVQTIAHKFPSVNYELAKVDTINFRALPDKEKRLERFKGTMGRHIQWYEEDLKKKKWKRKFRKQGRLIEKK